MHVKRLSLGCLLVASIAALAASPQAPATDPLVAKALAIHQRAITLDSHVDIGGANYATPALDPGAASTNLKCDLTKMEKGGLKGVFLAAFVGQGPLDDAGFKRAYDQAITKFEALQRLTQQMYPDRCAFATSPDDVVRIAKTGKRVIMTGVENGYPIGKDLGNVKKFYDLGARYITISHSRNNQLADSSSDSKPLNNGLTELGRQVVAEMNRLGIMVDVSHISDRAFWQVMSISAAPVIASHSAARYFVPGFERDISDDMIRALAARGGVVQVNFGSTFVSNDAHLWAMAFDAALKQFKAESGAAQDSAETAAFAKTYREEHPFPYASLGGVLDHIDHIVALVGVDSVGIGSDFDGVGDTLPVGLKDVSMYPNLIEGLLERGYDEAQIRNIVGENLLRVWGAVQKVAVQRGGHVRCVGRQPRR